VLCLLVVLVTLSVPVQVIDWKDSSVISEMTYNLLIGKVNPTHSQLWILDQTYPILERVCTDSY